MKALFIQFRRDPKMREQEYANVLRFSGLSKSELISVSAEKVKPSKELLNDMEAVVVGATGKSSITGDDPVTLEAWMDVLREARTRHLPIIGFNYGAHLLTLAFDGSVTRDEAKKELGTRMVKKEPEAEKDALFHLLPESFAVQVGHIDRIDTIPAQAQSLLSSVSSENECWCFPGEGIYACEFQLDLDKESFAQRIIDYQETFASKPGELEHYILSIKPSPEANKILSLFFKHIVKRPAAAPH